MSILLDTNVLLRLGDQGSPHHPTALAAVQRLHDDGQGCVLVPQAIYEYWVVSTRPLERNGLGMTTVQATDAIGRLLDTFRLLLDERGIYTHWCSLVLSRDVKGKQAHDARLVAAMQRHGLTNLLTFNKPDFIRYAGLNVFAPAEILAGALPV